MAHIEVAKPGAQVESQRRPSLKPQDVEPNHLVAMLLAEGETDHTLVDFPRKRADGSTIAKVHLRLLSDHEQTLAIANAVAEMQRLLRSGEAKFHPTLEHNLTVRYILAEACRDPEDPKKRFFRHHAPEVGQFQTSELSELWLAYIAVQNASLPSLGEMSGDEVEAWAQRVEEGVLDGFPFYFSSQERVVDFLRSVARFVVELRAEVTRLRAELSTATGSSGPA